MVKAMKNEKGSMLVMIVYIMAIIGILGTAFVTLSVSEAKIAFNQRDTALAFSIAEAGVEKAINNLNFDPGWRIEELEEELAEGHFVVSVKTRELNNQSNGNDDWEQIGTIIINSAGYYKSCARKIRVELNVYYNGRNGRQDKPKGKPPWAGGNTQPPWSSGPNPWYGGLGDYIYNISSWQEIYD